MPQDISLALTNENAVNLNILQLYQKGSNLAKFASLLIAFIKSFFLLYVFNLVKITCFFKKIKHNTLWYFPYSID